MIDMTEFNVVLLTPHLSASSAWVAWMIPVWGSNWSSIVRSAFVCFPDMSSRTARRSESISFHQYSPGVPSLTGLPHMSIPSTCPLLWMAIAETVSPAPMASVSTGRRLSCLT